MTIKKNLVLSEQASNNLKELKEVSLISESLIVDRLIKGFFQNQDFKKLVEYGK